MSTGGSFLLSFPALVALVLSGSVQGGTLAPGQTGGGPSFVLNLNDPSFRGQTLATNTVTQDVTDVDAFTDETIGVRITMTSLVVRESATGRLAFHYSVSGTESNATVDFENLDVTGFAGFTTDVFSSETGLTRARSTRSADGDTIGFAGDESWGADFVVRTDATEFSGGGRGVVWAQFQIGEPAGGPRSRYPAFETFRPVPEPASLLPAAATALLLRRRR